ncbi:MAG TPA: LLM class F420-dependent oxidoreductase [Dehalococcoidia bacterium]
MTGTLPAGHRWALTIPLSDLPLRQQIPLFQEAEDLGYTDLWTGEVNGCDGFTPLVAAATATRSVRLGTAVVNVYSRTPALLAMHAASLAELAPGRVCLGIGASSPPIVQGWHGVPFHRPLARVRDAVAVLRPMLAGEKVTAGLETLSVHGFRYGREPAGRIPLFLAALRPGMLRLAGQVADGVIINILPARDVPRAVAEVREAARAAGHDPDAVEIACRIFVCPTRNREEALVAARRFLAGYVTVRTYAAFHRWLGYGDLLGPAVAAWEAGDRRAALALLPESLVEDLVLIGEPEEVRERVLEYCRHGVTLPILQIFRTSSEPPDNTYGLRALAPSASVPGRAG